MRREDKPVVVAVKESMEARMLRINGERALAHLRKTNHPVLHSLKRWACGEPSCPLQGRLP